MRDILIYVVVAFILGIGFKSCGIEYDCRNNMEFTSSNARVYTCVLKESEGLT